MDLAAIKSQIDLRVLVESELGKPAARSGKTSMYKCPFHGEVKGHSLAVYADGWKCFGACQASGDVFDWVKKRQGFQTNTEALAYLGYTPDGIQRRKIVRHQPKPQTLEAATPPSERWQFFGETLVQWAEENLWGDIGAGALRYLKEQRGLSRLAIRSARLGYIPPEKPEDYQYGRVFDPDWQIDEKPVRMHCGITIPHYAAGQLWAIRIRRPPGIEGAKYMGIRGGSKALYWFDQLEPRLPILLVEGEFDALVAWQEAGPGCLVEVCPLALASASNKQLAPNWLAGLITAPLIYSRMDADGAGSKANEALQHLSARIRPVAVPEGYKDITEMHLGGAGLVRSWVSDLLK